MCSWEVVVLLSKVDFTLFCYITVHATVLATIGDRLVKVLAILAHIVYKKRNP